MTNYYCDHKRLERELLRAVAKITWSYIQVTYFTRNSASSTINHVYSQFGLLEATEHIVEYSVHRSTAAYTNVTPRQQSLPLSMIPRNVYGW